MMMKIKSLNIFLNLTLFACLLLVVPYASAQDFMQEETTENVDLSIGEGGDGIDVVSDVLLPEEELPAAIQQENQADIISEPEVKAVPHSGTYYDSDSILTGSNTPGPREVDPRYEPGSSFVVVSKKAGKNSSAARIISAQRALDLGRNLSALELYEGLYKENPKNQQVLMGLAVAQQKNGYEESAIATYEELLNLAPNNTDAMVNMFGLMKNQYPGITLRKLQGLWEQGHMNANIAAELGLTSAALGKSDDALKYLGMAVSMEPNNPLHFYNIAIINDRMGHRQEAIKNYETALDKDSSYGAGRTIERKKVYDRLARLRRL